MAACWRFSRVRRNPQVFGVVGGWVPQGQNAIHLARVYGERKQNFVGQHFWPREFLVSAVGRDEAVIRVYIRIQEKEDQQLEQLRMWQ
jgi:putative transposase